MSYIFMQQNVTETLGFCPTDLFFQYKNWVKLSEVTQAVRESFCGDYPAGKTLGVENNQPCWVDVPQPPAPSKSAQVKQLTSQYKSQVDQLNTLYVSALIADPATDDPKKLAIKQQIADLNTAYNTKVQQILTGK